jgi:hypothetical protein
VIDELITSTGVDRVKFIKWMQVEKIEQLAADNYDRIVAELEKRK